MQPFPPEGEFPLTRLIPTAHLAIHDSLQKSLAHLEETGPIATQALEVHVQGQAQPQCVKGKTRQWQNLVDCSQRSRQEKKKNDREPHFPILQPRAVRKMRRGLLSQKQSRPNALFTVMPQKR